jgi:hypothetical protein
VYSISVMPIAIRATAPRSDCRVASATVLATEAARPRSWATRSGDASPEGCTRPPRAATNSAAGSSQRNTRKAIPPASSEPARRRSSSPAWSAAMTSVLRSRSSSTRRAAPSRVRTARPPADRSRCAPARQDRSGRHRPPLAHQRRAAGDQASTAVTNAAYPGRGSEERAARDRDRRDIRCEEPSAVTLFG